MDIKRLSYKPGTIVIDKETGELLQVSYFTTNQVCLEYLNGDEGFYDYIGKLGKVYIKSKVAKLLYGCK